MSNKTPARIELIPWDHTSDEQYERMVTQRVNCGWMSELVGRWRDRAANGTRTMYWILLADDHPGRDEQLALHTSRYPNEVTPVLDTASTLWNSPREASERAILPIGHVGMGPRTEGNAEIGLPSQGVVWIGPLYVSWALQNYGLGHATMQAIEAMAARPPLNGELTALDAIPKEYQFAPAIMNRHYLPLGNRPAQANETWYRKQGYEEFHVDPQSYTFIDEETGEEKPMPSIYFKKRIERDTKSAE